MGMRRRLHTDERGRSGWFRTLTVLPGAGMSLLPIGACPACLPAYTGLLSALGLGFLLDATYLFPVTGSLFAIALATLAHRARSRRGYGPLGLGITAASVALLGKFALSSDSLLYVGLALLVGASVWNAWPRKSASTGSCAECASQVPVSQHSSARD